MGKRLIIKGADFSVNSIPENEYEWTSFDSSSLTRDGFYKVADKSFTSGTYKTTSSTITLNEGDIIEVYSLATAGLFTIAVMDGSACAGGVAGSDTAEEVASEVLKIYKYESAGTSYVHVSSHGTKGIGSFYYRVGRVKK